MLPDWSESCGRVTIRAVTTPMGKDLCVVITGGDGPHLGAVALAQPRRSLEDAARISASTSVLTLPGHKEDMLARRVAERLAAARNVNVVVCCGIHVDHISASELKAVDEAIGRFCELAEKVSR